MRIALSILAATAAATATAAVATTPAAAAPTITVPARVSFAGHLATTAGPVDGPVKLRFQLYAGTTVIFSEVHEGVTATSGLVFATLGSIDPSGNPLDENIFSGVPLDLEITVNGEVLSPRLPIQSVPYAIHAGVADRLGDLGPENVALADHNHDGRYLLLGSNRTCSGSQKVTSIGANGNVTCSEDLDTKFTAGEGLALANTVFSIVNAGVTAAKIAAAAVTTDKLADNAVTNAKLANDAVNTVELVNGAVTEAKIANVAITNAKLANDAVTGSKIANGTVNADEIADGAVNTVELANNAVTAAKIADNTITAAKIANGAVGTAELANGTVTRNKLGSDPVALHVMATGCEDPGVITNKAICTTRLCSAVPQKFLDCSGTCDESSARSCDNRRLGFLVPE